ncbi:MAG TPA: type 1 glutamine amidotransferase domain-containing protein [Nitrospira sp.]|nr:type 1 glutamine amidotransferase domain-containing protein [Nitrospira sp.]
MQHGRLKSRRIAVLVADGFEKVELTVPVAALRIAGAKVDIVSLRRGRIRGMNLHEPASRVHVHVTVCRADPNDYDGVLVPGGCINPDLLRQSAAARAFVRWFDERHKPIASLCHGPWLLASADCLQGRTLTSWPGIRDDMVNAGATWLDKAVVRDGNLITSRGPQDLVPFIQAIKQLFSEPYPIQRARIETRPSDPQRNDPPTLVLSAMKWMPRPSLRTAIGIDSAIALFATRPTAASLQRPVPDRKLEGAGVVSGADNAETTIDRRLTRIPASTTY